MIKTLNFKNAENLKQFLTYHTFLNILKYVLEYYSDDTKPKKSCCEFDKIFDKILQTCCDLP